MRGRHEILDRYYLSNSYFDSPKRSIQNNSNKTFLFNQTLNGIENIYRDVSGYDMNYDEFKSLCRESWKDEYNCLGIDRSKWQIKEKILFKLKAKTCIQNVFQKRNLCD